MKLAQSRFYVLKQSRRFDYKKFLNHHKNRVHISKQIISRTKG